MNSCTFGPGIPDTCATAPHAASPLSLLGTETPLWAYLSVVAFALLASWSASWLKDRYELSGRRPVRRWYGSTARVILRGNENDPGAPRYAVLAWDAGDCEVPWLKARQLAGDSFFWDDAEPFWAPVTQFAPHSVRTFSPHLRRAGRFPVPVLFASQTLPCPRRTS
jgi:hypothetical protein